MTGTLNPRTLDVNKHLSGLSDFLQRFLGQLFNVEVVGGSGLWTVEVESNVPLIKGLSLPATLYLALVRSSPRTRTTSRRVQFVFHVGLAPA